MPQPTPRPDFRKNTAALASKLGWWWRREAALKKVQAESYEWPALLYEIGRRLKPDEFPEARAIGKEWPQFTALLPDWQAEFAGRWPDPNLKAGEDMREVTAAMLSNRHLTFPGWSKPVSFNLARSVAALAASFEDFITKEKKRLRAKVQTGRGSKPLPWESVEMFDVQQYREDHPRTAPGVVLDYSSIAKMKKLWRRHRE